MGSRTVRVGLAVLLAGAMVAVQFRVDAARPKRNADDLLYLPNERLLNHFTAGLNNVIADYLWVQCCTYVGRQVKEGWNFQWLQTMLDTVVRLDPHFVSAYRYGAMFLASLRQEDQAALDLLHRGMVLNPESWELPYEAAMVHLLNRRDAPDSKYNAALYLAVSAETGRAPALVAETAAALQGQYNLFGLEKDMWTKLADSPDSVLRDLAKAKLDEVRLKDNVRVLNDLIERHRVQFGEPPQTLDRLIEVGYIPYIVPDEHGGKYFLGVDGRAWNETLLGNSVRDLKGKLEAGVKTFKEAHAGAAPGSLAEAAAAGLLDSVPPHPWPGKQWTYDAATGAVSDEEKPPNG